MRQLQYVEQVPATPQMLARLSASIADVRATIAGARGAVVAELREALSTLEQLQADGRITFWHTSGRFAYASFDYPSGQLRLHVNPQFGNAPYAPGRLLHEAIHAVHAGRYPAVARAYGEVLAAGQTGDERLGVLVLRWKAWTEYWAYRRAVEYDNLRQEPQFQRDPDAEARAERDVRASIDAVHAQTGEDFDPAAWSPPASVPRPRRGAR